MTDKLDVAAFWERCQKRYPIILARLHEHEKAESLTARLRETYDSVLTERMPDDLRQLVERLK